MQKILLTFLLTFFSFSLFADEKPGRFFKDQPDITKDPQVHLVIHKLSKELGNNIKKKQAINLQQEQGSKTV